MKNLKKMIIAVATFWFCSTNAQIGLSVKAGGNVNFMSTNTLKEYEYDTNVVNYHIGLTYEIPIYNQSFYIEPGVFLDSRGFRIYKEDSKGRVTRIKVISIPILVKKKFYLWEKLFFFEAGPVCDIGLSAFSIESGADIQHSSVDQKTRINISFGSNPDELKKSHLGLYLGVGNEWGRYFWSAGYHLGVSNIYNDKKATLNSIKLSLGYRF